MKYTRPVIEVKPMLFEDIVCNNKHVCNSGTFKCSSFRCKKSFTCKNTYKQS